MSDSRKSEWSAAIARARESLAARSEEELADIAAKLVARNPRPQQLAEPIARLALEFLADPPEVEALDTFGFGTTAELRIETSLFSIANRERELAAIGKDEAASWGDVRLVAGGRPPLTRHRRLGGAGNDVDDVRWFLLPFVEWVIENADTMFAVDEGAGSAWRRLGEPATGVPLPRLEFSPWVHHIEIRPRSRHFVFPPMEFSPEETPMLVDAVSAGAALRDWCVAVADSVHQRAPTARTAKVRERAQTMELVPSTIEERVAKAPLQAAVGAVQAQVGERFRECLKDVRHRPSPLRLAFGSSSPRIAEGDALEIFEAIDELGRSELERDERLDGRWPTAALRKPPWAQGQRLAHEAIRKFELDDSVVTDLDGLYDGLGVPLRFVRLEAPDVRGLVAGYPQAAPAVFLNETCSKNLNPGAKRFWLAHELCHVLFDQNVSRSMGLVEGDWAPADTERRANAFAAMFLMPAPLVRRKIDELGTSLTLSTLADSLETSFTATQEHVQNLHQAGDLDDEVVARLLV